MVAQYDVIIVGAGVMGLSSAYRLAKRGKKSTSPCNLMGGSHGESRIIRLIHSEKVYVPMAKESYKLWRLLEHETGSKLFENHGVLWLGDKQGSLERAAILAQYGAPHEFLNSQQIKDRYMHLNYDSKWFAVLDHTGGTIYARKCLEALKKACDNLGVDFHYGQRMTRWKSDNNHVTVTTSNQAYHGKHLVLCVGGWISKAVPELTIKIQPVAVPVYFWDVKPGHEGLFEIEKKSPNLIMTDVWKDEEIFMIPNVDFKGKVKFGIHKGEPFEIDTVRPTNHVASNREIARNHIRDNLKFVDARMPTIEYGCLYANTEDKAFVIDRHPKHNNVVLVSGFSGTGFKFGVYVGEIVSNLVDNQPPKTDITPFSVSRKIDLSKAKL